MLDEAIDLLDRATLRAFRQGVAYTEAANRGETSLQRGFYFEAAADYFQAARTIGEISFALSHRKELH